MGDLRETVVDRLLHNARTRGHRPAMYVKNGPDWQAISWSAHARACREFAGGLIAAGVEPGGAVAIMANNSPAWVQSALGAMIARVVPAGVYQTSTPEQLAYVAHNCEARVLVLENRAMYDRFAAARDAMPHVKRVVMFNDAPSIDDPMVESFASFLTRGREHLGEVDRRVMDLREADLATLIYTSGTTGPPKAVMLSHANVSWSARKAIEINGHSDDECSVSYLPLSHIAEQMFTIYLPTVTGSEVWFAEAMDKVRDVLLAARPTVFLGVPRVWEKLKSALETRLAQATGARAKLAGWARRVGLEAGHQRFTHGAARGLLGAQFALADRVVFHKIRAALGLDRLRIGATGAAPIGYDVLEFFLSIGIPLHEVYGQSEGVGLASYNCPFPGRRKLGSAGLPVPGVEMKLATDGEILLRGPNIFVGYLKDEAATRDALIDGWLHTGDVGEFDADGFLKITDRKKDLIITSGGKNVAPQNVEKLLRTIDGVAQAAAIGDRRHYVTALLTLDPERAAALATSQGWPAERAALCTHPGFIAHVQRGIDRISGDLARYEQVRRFTLLPNDFTNETGELTPTMKLKRKAIAERYAAQIESMYPPTPGESATG